MSTRIVRAEANIAAPVDVIWDIMLDLKGYSEWNPFIVGAIGCDRITAVGQRFRLKVVWSNGTRVTSGERVRELTSPQNGRARLVYTFTGWVSSIGMIRAERVQALDSLDGGIVRYSTEERFTGWGLRTVPFVYIEDGFERHAATLKRHAEERAQSKRPPPG